MKYQDKHLIDGTAPDSFDLDDDPMYQRFLSRQKQNEIKNQLKQILESDDDKANATVTKAAYF